MQILPLSQNYNVINRPSQSNNASISHNTKFSQSEMFNLNEMFDSMNIKQQVPQYVSKTSNFVYDQKLDLYFDFENALHFDVVNNF